MKTIDLRLSWDQVRPLQTPLSVEDLVKWITLESQMLRQKLYGSTTTVVRFKGCPEELWQQFSVAGTSQGISPMMSLNAMLTERFCSLTWENSTILLTRVNPQHKSKRALRWSNYFCIPCSNVEAN